uniref:Uncharacterized protein n=1 Tax=Avena sativa TaxID=4498 RepID=A0ACD5VD17_AVESA
MLILDGCDGLENIVALGRLPPPIKYFSLDGYGPASQRTPTVELPPIHFRLSTAEDKNDISTSKISLEGCTKLESLFLRGIPNLVEPDLSGTAIKILDFRTMVVQVPRLKRLYLIGCKHLRAIICFQSRFCALIPELELMCIDTRAATLSSRPFIDNSRSFGLQVQMVILDARIAHALKDLLDHSKEVFFNIWITMSPVYDRFVQFEAINKYKISPNSQAILQHLTPAGWYTDVLSMVGDPPMQAFPQPPATRLDIHIEIAEGSCHVESGLKGALGYLMGCFAESLYLHDVLIHAIIPKGEYKWLHLRWCCVERCPKLDTVFPSGSCEFPKLETLWASELLMARWIWSKGSRHGWYTDNTNSFKNLKHLHLHSCPRLHFVLPVWVSSFPSLETLHLIHCGDLVHVFELDGWHPEEIISHGVLFPKLRTIHFHDLPKLQHICDVKMVAPALKTIKIRGCWGLQQLPSVQAPGPGVKKPTIEIEKEVWDALEWDADHRPDHFEAPVHSRYYKKKLPKVSFLR